jgi:hypothetical protein
MKVEIQFTKKPIISIREKLCGYDRIFVYSCFVYRLARLLLFVSRSITSVLRPARAPERSLQLLQPGPKTGDETESTETM